MTAATGEATAYWTAEPGRGELRREPLRSPAPDEALVRTLRSGISRGTESLVHRGLVPAAVSELMRAPFQAGDFPGPVKYGYLSVGVVEDGPAPLLGRRVFCLYPHQDRYVVAAGALSMVPDDVPSDRGVLAGPVETALNAIWDAAPRFGDCVAVVGAGMIGASVAALLRRFPLERLELVDPDPQRQGLATALGFELVAPDDASSACDVVFHCSATESGLRRSLEIAAEEGEVVELSWYGANEPRVPLGAAFHARRLTIRASQVGVVSASRRIRRTPAERRAAALQALCDPVFDALLTGPVRFADLPAAMDGIADGTTPAVCHVVTYPDA
jgi:threonine dehydrogenase-like Zn-dependent dehydrogenase